ncbi:MAG: hypothetical protein QOG30_2707, partial [Acidimicrobiaceae bacterium]
FEAFVQKRPVIGPDIESAHIVHSQVFEGD